MIKLQLYGGALSRAAIVQWYLEELQVPYEFVMVDMRAGAHFQPGFLALNPMGKSPVIVDGDFKLWESGAILLYLADKHGIMPDFLEQRAEITKWVLFANSTLWVGIFVEANREREMPRLLPPLNDIFERQPFLLGDYFSVADVAVGSILYYIPIKLKLDLSSYPAILNYLKQLSQRPAFQNTIGKKFG